MRHPKHCLPLAAAVVLFAAHAATAQESVTFASWGGDMNNALMKGLFSSKDQLKIAVREDLHGGVPGLRAQVRSGNVAWDLVDFGFAQCERASQEGLFEPLDYTVIDTGRLNKEYVRPNYIGAFTFSYGVAHNKKKFPADPPKNWADFWNVSKYPGPRTMWESGIYALEAALMADRVAIPDVYKVLSTQEGVDRAFKKMEEIKPHVSVWWKSSSQSMQLLRDGEVEVALMANGRAAALIRDGANIGFSWDQATIEPECLAIPKGAKNKAAAMKLINASLDPEPQARFSSLIDYGPINPKAFSLGIIPKEREAMLPTAPQNLPKLLPMSEVWYASDIGKSAIERFLRFTTR